LGQETALTSNTKRIRNGRFRNGSIGAPGCAWFHGMNKREKEAYEEERLQEKREKHFLLCYLTIV